MIKIIVPGFGAGKYQVAAWCSQKRLTQILDSPNSNANLIHYELASPKTGGISETNFFRYKGDWFLHKLKIWEKNNLLSYEKIEGTHKTILDREFLPNIVPKILRFFQNVA